MLLLNVLEHPCKVEWVKGQPEGRQTLTAQVDDSTDMTVVLGKVRQTNDGRYEWSSFPAKYFRRPDGVKIAEQGRCDTEHEAKEKVLIRWGVPKTSSSDS